MCQSFLLYKVRLYVEVKCKIFITFNIELYYL
jgi:hypothetical protein